MRDDITCKRVMDALEQVQPADAIAVWRAVGVEWGARGTVRNRLDQMVQDHRVIVDEDCRPALYAINEIYEEPYQ